MFEFEKKKLFLRMSSTNIDTFVLSLSQCVEIRSIEVFWLLSRPLPHLRLYLIVISETFAIKVEPLYATNTSQHNQETFLYEYSLHQVLFPIKKTHNITLLFGYTLLMHGHHFDYWNQPLNMRICVCYLDCHEAGLWCYLVIQKAHYIHYSCFTPICDLFTDSLS
jgi:hypothetical protein